MNVDKTNIALIGYRGCGKSTIGRLLADRLHRDFVDTDQMVISESGMSIADIFEQFGEPEFRSRESTIVQRIARRTNIVIALGGGAILDPYNQSALRRSSVVLWLNADVDTLWRRIQSDTSSTSTRPALTTQSGIEEVRQMLHSRESIYRQCADHIIDANLSPQEVVDAISKVLP